MSIHYKTILAGAAFAATVGSATFAQETMATDAAKDPAVACEADYMARDLNGDGFLSDEESPRDFARSRIDGTTIPAEGLSNEEYLRLCGSDQWANNTPEEGAPFEGENSFTEEQARDRAVAWNVTAVSPLVLDDKGIWRGTGTVNGAEVKIAVDYKGNVVTTP